MATPVQSFDVHIITPETKLFEGKATALTANNKRGPFDILPYHTNFVSIIFGNVIVHDVSGEKKTVPIQNAILKSFQNNVHIFVGIEEEEQMPLTKV